MKFFSLLGVALAKECYDLNIIGLAKSLIWFLSKFSKEENLKSTISKETKLRSM